MGKLTDRQIQAFTYPKDKGRHADGDSLFLDVRSGSKVWMHRYRWKKPSGEWSEKTVTIGHYPQAGWKARLPVGLAEARRENARLRALEAQGVDPALQRKEEKAETLNARLAEEQKTANTFEAVASEWLDKFAPSRAASYTKSLEGRLRLHLFPGIGERPIDAVTPQEILATVRRIEAKGHLETAHRVLELAGQVFNYAIQTDRASINPALPLKGALPPACGH